MGLAMKEMFAQNMKSITIGANALSDYKRVLGGGCLNIIFLCQVMTILKIL